MKSKITILFCLLVELMSAQIQNEISTSGFHSSSLSFSVGNIYMSGRVESGLIAHSLIDSVAVSVQNEEIKIAEIYPNPARHYLFIQHPLLTKQVQILDANGQLVSTKELKNGTLDIHDLNSGFYIIRVDKNNSIPFIKM